jgi:hypothetical protein
MGNINCCIDDKIKYDEKNKIYQINRLQDLNLIKDNISQNSKEEYINNNNLNNGKYQLLSYDIEENTLFTYTIKIPIINSLKGLSELNLNSKLYLCGTPSISEDASSYLFQITFQTLNTKIMVSSQYGHFYPSLISINNNKIMCIGGKNQTRCELYDTIINHWSIIPELPEERYKCTLCFDFKNKFLYLFGGINTEKNSINSNYIEKESILRINTKNSCFTSWERILVESKIENKLLTRISSASLFLDENNIILIGGENENGKILKNIIKYNLIDSSISLTGKYLDFPSKFINQSTIINIKDEDNNNINYFFDSKNNIHNINKQQFLNNSENKEELKMNITN